MARNALQGALSTRAERLRFLTRVYSFAGVLPKELGKLINLEVFDVERNALEGALSTRAERFMLMLTFHFVLQENCPRNSANL